MSGPTPEAAVRAESATAAEPIPRPTLTDRLRAEAVRVLERERGEPFDEPAANEAAVEEPSELERTEEAEQASGFERASEFESRIIVRARHLSAAPDLTRAIGHLRSVTLWVILLVLLAALLLGAGTARATMTAGNGGRINFFWVVGSVLGVQSLLLLVWAGVATRWTLRRDEADRESPMLLSLGRLVVAAGQWVAAKSSASGPHRAVANAAGRVLGTGRIGFWTFSSLTHAVWLAFNIGALALVVLLLSARQYTFVWETTILDERHYVAMTEALSTPARAFGFSVPTEADIAESQWTGESTSPVAPEAEGAADGRSQRWASLLAACILLYGAGPRALLLALSAISRRRACRGFRLDLALPGYERLRPVLVPASRSLGVVDPALEGPDARGPAAGATAARPIGPPAIVGVEIGRPAAGWPPRLEEITFQDLGVIESREDRERILGVLESAEREPGPLVIVCELTTTPDRGIGRILESLRRTVNASPALALTGGQTLRERGYDAERIEARLKQWRDLGERAGVDPASILVVDLDHLTDVAAAQLAERLGGWRGEEGVGARREGNGAGAGRQQEGAGARRLPEASDIIERHVERWIGRDAPPREAEQVALHREIGALYRRSGGFPRSLFALTPERPRASMKDIQAGVSRFVGLLPPRLRANPRWLAAGALAGAFGCVATSALLAPVALAALPSWSVIGAAIAAGLKGIGTGDEPAGPVHPEPDLSDAVRAAALFAVVLELQGRDEAAITRVIDGTFPEDSSDPDGSITDARAVSGWLAAVRRRFDEALEREERP